MLNGRVMEGAMNQLHGLMDAADRGLTKYQSAPPGFKERSPKEKREIFKKIQLMEPDEREVKLSDIAAIVGEEELVRFLMDMSKES